MNLKKVFTLIERNSFDPLKQNLKQRTYYPARLPGDGKILSTDSILEIENKIRALTFPYPGAYIEYKNKKIVIDGVKPLPVTRQALGIENSGQGQIFIKASDGLLLATKIRRRL
jgi:methionyl-tRNA formyltransferase